VHGVSGATLTLFAALVAFVGLRRLAHTPSVEPAAAADDGRRLRGAESSKRPPCGPRPDGPGHRLAGSRSWALATTTPDPASPKLEAVSSHNPMVTRWCHMRQAEPESVPAGPIPERKGMT
jgi:hypothetical protein